MLPELAALRTPPFSVTCSIGVALFPIHASIPSDLVVAADAAVYVAKRGGEKLRSHGEPCRPFLTAPLAPCTILNPRVTVTRPRMRGSH